jgi:hypothetical protein
VQWFVDKLGPAASSVLVPGELVVAATPAVLPEPLPPVPPPAHSPRPRGATIVAARLEPTGLPFVGRMILVATDARLLVFERRKWRNRPGRLLGQVPLEALGNVEGSVAATRRITDLELVVILADGTACHLKVPPANVRDGREFVRRVQARLLG